MKYKRSGMKYCSEILDWIVNYDALNTEIKVKQDYILSRYIPYLFVFIHHISACVNPGKVKFPTLKNEVCRLLTYFLLN